MRPPDAVLLDDNVQARDLASAYGVSIATVYHWRRQAYAGRVLPAMREASATLQAEVDAKPLGEKPPTPGLVLVRDFLRPIDRSQTWLAERMGCSNRVVSEIVCGTRKVTPRTALRLAEVLGNNAEFWLWLQVAVDVWEARKARSPG